MPNGNEVTRQKGARIKIAPGEALQAPGVAITPARVLPSPIATLAESIKPFFAKGTEVKTGRNIILSSIEGFESDVARLNEEGQLDEVSLKALTAQHQSAMTKQLLRGGVDPQFYSGAREQFKFATESNQFFQVEKDGDFVTTHNTISGKTQTTFKTLEKAQANIQENVVALIPPTIIQKSIGMQGQELEVFLAPYMANATKDYQNIVQVKQELSSVTAVNNLAEQKQENKQNLTAGIYNNIFNTKLSSMNIFKDSLVVDMRASKLTPAEATAMMEDWFTNLRQDPDLNEALADEMGRDPQAFFKEMDSLQKDMVGIITSLDPQKELTREVMGKELALRNMRADVMLSMPERARNQLLVSTNMQSLVMSNFYMKSSFAKDIPAIAYMSLIQNDEIIVRERFAPTWAAASDEDPAGEDFSNTNAATQMVLNSLYHITKGDMTNPEAATVENTLVMLEKLKQLNSYAQLSPKVKLELDRRANSLYSVFEEDKDVLRVLRKYVDEQKEEGSGFVSAFFGTAEEEK